jgi:hypothetical protein
LEKKAQTDNSVASGLSNDTSDILDMNWLNESTNCQATKLRINSEGNLEIIGSCLGSGEEKTKKNEE